MLVTNDAVFKNINKKHTTNKSTQIKLGITL